MELVLDGPVAADAGGDALGAGAVWGGAGDAERGDRGAGAAVQVTDVPLDGLCSPTVAAVRDLRQCRGCGRR